MRQLRRLLREPSFHFLVIGGLLIWFYWAVLGPAAPTNGITIRPGRVAQLAARFEAVWGRRSSDKDVWAIVDN
jgi:hypothetical protein